METADKLEIYREPGVCRDRKEVALSENIK